MSAQVSGTEGYAEEAEELFRRYESISGAETHRAVLHLIPAAPAASWISAPAPGAMRRGSPAMAIASLPSSRRRRCGCPRWRCILLPASNGSTTACPNSALRAKPRRNVRPDPAQRGLDASRSRATPAGDAERRFAAAKRRHPHHAGSARAGAAGTAHVRSLGRGDDRTRNDAGHASRSESAHGINSGVNRAAGVSWTNLAFAKK